jgi:hypothetical protein
MRVCITVLANAPATPPIMIHASHPIASIVFSLIGMPLLLHNQNTAKGLKKIQRKAQKGLKQASTRTLVLPRRADDKTLRLPCVKGLLALPAAA